MIAPTTVPAEPAEPTAPAAAEDSDTLMEEAASPPKEPAAPPKPIPRVRPQRADDGEDPLEAFMKLNAQQLTTSAQPAAGEDEEDPLDAFMAAEIVPQVHKAFAPVRAAVGDATMVPGGQAAQASTSPAKPSDKDGAAAKAGKRKRSAIRYDKSDESDIGEEDNSEDDMDDAVRWLLCVLSVY